MKILANIINHNKIYDRVDEIMDVVNSQCYADRFRVGMRELNLRDLHIWLSSFDNEERVSDHNYYVSFYEEENGEYQVIAVYYVDDNKAIKYIDVAAEREERRKMLIAEKVLKWTDDILHDGQCKDTVESVMLKIDNNPYEVFEDVLKVLDVLNDINGDLVTAERETWIKYKALKDEKGE